MLKSMALYMRLPEMRLFWILFILVCSILAIDMLYFPFNWMVISAVSLLVILLITFKLSMGLVKSNTEAKAASYQLESIISNIKDGVIAYDNDFKMLIFNDAVEQIFGIKREEVIGQCFGPDRVQGLRFRLLAQTMFPSLAPMVVKRSESGSYPQVADLSFDEPNLELRVSTSRLLNEKGEAVGFIKLIHNRTRELQIYRSKSEFIMVAAHHLRTPLTAVHWTFENLSKDTTLSEEDAHMVKNGITVSIKLLKIVNDLLDVSKIEEGKFGYEFENVEFIEFINGILENANVLAKQYKVNVYFDRGPESAIILKIDPNRLGLAISNLIDNAIKYNVENGSVTIKLERLPGKPYIQVSIKDTGVGIPPESMPKLFTKFFRAENVIKFRTEGSGLGLYIAKNIFNRHGGVVWSESILGRGTTFYFTLPTDAKLIPPKEITYDEVL